MNSVLPAPLDTALRGAWARLSGDAGGVWIRAARKSRTSTDALERILRASMAGHPAGDYELGLAHWDGLMGSGEGNPKGEAVACFLRAAEGGHAGAMMMLGEASRDGQGAARSMAKALDWFSRAARAGNLRAARTLAQIYELGEGDGQDVVKATIWRELSGPGPVPELPRSCAFGLDEGLPAMAPEAEDAALEAPTPGLLARLPEHLGSLLLFTGGGFLVIFGLLVAAVNLMGFIRWFKTGNLIFAISTFPLFILPGVCLSIWILMRGKDVDRRARRASTRLLELAEAGDREACFRLGRAFLQGDPEHPKDEDTARRWLRKGAELGHPEAAVNLAHMMRWGAGGPKDLDGATTWLRSAAENGSLEAMHLLRSLAPARSLDASDLLTAWSGPRGSR